MRTLGISVESPLSLPCCSYSNVSGGGGGIRSPAVDSKLIFSSVASQSSLSAKCTFKRCLFRANHTRRATKISATSNPGNSPNKPFAPVQLESPAGQLLLQIMQSHPHLLNATIDQQLERIQLEREEQERESESRSPQDQLYRRISELKDKERKKSLQEIIYCLILQKFTDADITLIPKIITASSADIITEIDSQNQETNLFSIHSPDALEMIHSHLSIVLSDQSVGPLSNTSQMSKLKIGKLYAASIMYGYFLKRVDERYQLERSMNTLPDVKKLPKMFEGMEPNPLWDLESMVQITSDDDEYEKYGGVGEDGEEQDHRLRSYVMYLDPETLQRYATMRSKEAVSIIEKQTQALFGRPDIVVAGDGSLTAMDDEIVTVTSRGVTMLVLEAVAFGSFLWDAEGYVESKYHFVNNA